MFENELSQFDEIFQNAKNSSAPELPDGKHKGQVTGVFLTKTKKNNTPMIVIQFIDSATDWPVDVIQVLSIKSIPFVKQNLLAIGFPTAGKFSENLLAFCEGFKMPKHVILEKKTKGEFANYTLHNDNDSDNEVPF